jgi:hypothetical protein
MTSSSGCEQGSRRAAVSKIKAFDAESAARARPTPVTGYIGSMTRQLETDREVAALNLRSVEAGPEQAADCGVCGRSVDEVDGGADWLHIEVTRADPAEFFYATFCTQAHAADWLTRQLPAPAPPAQAVKGLVVERLWAMVFVFCAICPWG